MAKRSRGIEALEGVSIAFGFLTFAGVWAYCTAQYGFLFGFGLGWIPAGMVGVLSGLAMRYGWWVMLLGVVAVALLFVFKPS